jgi:DNA-directed RNA polymerase specialized sigma24 family protein
LLPRGSPPDETAAHVLIDRLHPLVANLVHWFLPQRRTEHELAQAGFVAILGGLQGRFDREPPEQWVSRIVVRTCLRELGQDRVLSSLRLCDLSKAEQGLALRLRSGHEALSSGQGSTARSLMEKLLVRLNPDARFVVGLMDVGGHGVKAVSRVTGWPVWRVRVKVFLARWELRRRLDALLRRSES